MPRHRTKERDPTFGGLYSANEVAAHRQMFGERPPYRRAPSSSEYYQAVISDFDDSDGGHHWDGASAPIRSGRHTSEAEEDSLDSLESPPPYSPSRRRRHPTPASDIGGEALSERSLESRAIERGMIQEALDGKWDWNEWAVVMGDCPRGG